MGRPRGTYTTQQHQDLMLFGAPPSPPVLLRDIRATPAKAHQGEFPPETGIKSGPKLGPDLSKERSWLALRNKALKPRHVSQLVTTQQSREEFLEGARLLRFVGETARPGSKIYPQQMMLSDMLAAGHKRNGVLMPRRSAKSTSAIIVGLGRAACREDYRVGILTLTSGKAGRSRFLKDVAPPIERLYPDKTTRPFKLIKIAGMEGVSWPATGGSMTWLSTLDDIRGEAFDLLFLDEAGEPNDPEQVIETIGAALPTLDTRPGAQLVVLGTAGRYRAGNMLWDSLELGRNGQGGILEYSMPDHVTEEQLASWLPTEEHPEGNVRDLIKIAHPGVGTLTTLESIRTNYVTMTGNGAKTESFSREYGGIFGELGATRGIFDIMKWADCGVGGELPEPPERYGLAMVAHPDQLAASIIAAWRDGDGKAHALLLEHRTGVEWLPLAALKAARRKGMELCYDSGSQVVLLAVESLNRARPRPKMRPMTFMDVKKAAALVVDEVYRGNAVHYRQPELDDAVKLAIKRKAGVNGWALGRPISTDDITPVEGWGLALLAYDEGKPKPERRAAVVRT